MKALIYPFIALSFSLFAHFFPEFFLPFQSHIVTFLMIIMLGMGLTLNFTDFKRILNKKAPLVFGVLFQFIFMPLIAIIISKILNLSEALTIGMILVGTSAGGTASNVITYLAKGDLALSVSMTLLSTVLSVFLMPLLSWLYIGKSIEIKAASMLFDVAKITILPIFIGIVLNTLFNKFISKIKFLLPLISMSAIIFIISVIIALNTQNLKNIGVIVIFAVILHNLIGMLSSYYLFKLLGYDSKISRTIAIEVGIQNSGLSVAIAMKYFTSLSALIGALFSIWQNISGAIFASFISQKDK